MRTPGPRSSPGPGVESAGCSSRMRGGIMPPPAGEEATQRASRKDSESTAPNSLRPAGIPDRQFEGRAARERKRSAAPIAACGLYGSCPRLAEPCRHGRSMRRRAPALPPAGALTQRLSPEPERAARFGDGKRARPIEGARAEAYHVRPGPPGRVRGCARDEETKPFVAWADGAEKREGVQRGDLDVFGEHLMQVLHGLGIGNVSGQFVTGAV